MELLATAIKVCRNFKMVWFIVVVIVRISAENVDATVIELFQPVVRRCDQ